MQTLNETQTNNALFITPVLKAWSAQVSRLNDLFNTLTDEELSKEISPGKNSTHYLLGHLVAVNDGIFPLLGLGDKRYPELAKTFITTPDHSGLEFPSAEVLKKYWAAINEELLQEFSKLKPEEWLEKHTAVSAEDFVKEPHRNKYSILISRTTHMSYHLGQIVWTKKK